MSASLAATPDGAQAQPAPRAPMRTLGLYLLLGFSAGLPFYMFNAVLTLRLARHGVDIVIIGFFAWIALLPTFKFVWAPLLDRYSVPGFSRFWGRRRGWIMLSQLGIFLSMVAMAFTSSDQSLPLTALFAILLAFWTTTLEVAADGWRIELAPTQAQQARYLADHFADAEQRQFFDIGQRFTAGLAHERPGHALEAGLRIVRPQRPDQPRAEAVAGGLAGDQREQRCRMGHARSPRR